MEDYCKLTKALPYSRNQEVIQEFLSSLKFGNRSEGTIKLYRQFLEYFFSDKKDDFDEISSEAIWSWFQENLGHVKVATFRLKLSVLSSFYTFCIGERYIDRTPIKRRWYPRLPKPIPKYLDKEELAKVRTYLDNIQLRDQVMIEFMLVSGCRVGELQQLNRDDIDLEERTATVLGKGSKIRHIHFTDRCSILLERYMEKCPEGDGALFVTKTGHRLSKRQIQYIVNDIGKDSGLSKHLHAHRLRHTFSTELLAKGAELSFIGEELGHSDLSTTQIYANLPQKEVVAEYRKFMG